MGYYPLSIITRIETSHFAGRPNGEHRLLSPFHYNKDWNLWLKLHHLVCLALLSPFHYNKDWNNILSFILYDLIRLLSPFHYNKDWNHMPLPQRCIMAFSYYPLSIITRIETNFLLTNFPFPFRYYPLSIITRIETHNYLIFNFSKQSYYPLSIITRIET